MKHRWAALGAVLALSALMPRAATAQTRADTAKVVWPSNAPFALGQNYPNPFSPETRIPFVVGNPTNCSTERGKKYRVTMKIFNLLAQLVAVPVLKGDDDDKPDGERLDNLSLSCRPYTAYWDGKDLTGTREVGSGVYLYKLEVDGKAVVKKMVIVK
jgi:hypothetical protein